MKMQWANESRSALRSAPVLESLARSQAWRAGDWEMRPMVRLKSARGAYVSGGREELFDGFGFGGGEAGVDFAIGEAEEQAARA
jgi:hypothetical protein